MKRENCQILMVAAIAAMMLVPVVPCGGNWVYLGSDGSSGLPPSDSNETSGPGWLEGWSYTVSNIDRGGDSGGSWASADFISGEYASVSSNGGSSASASPDNPQPGVWGESYYADIPNPNYTAPGLTLSWSLYASGTVSVWGSVEGDLGSGDSGDASASASGSCGGYEWGSGQVGGSVSENSTGSAWAEVYGYAEETSTPDITQSAGYFSARLSFRVDGYDTAVVEADPPNNPGPNQYTAAAGISVGAEAYASISASAGHSGHVQAEANAEFGGGASVGVTMP